MAEEQTKIKQVRSQLKASEYDSQQTVDTLDNLPVFWSFWEDPGEPEGLFKHRYLLFTTSTAVFDIKPVMVFADGRELQTKSKEAWTTPLRW